MHSFEGNKRIKFRSASASNITFPTCSPFWFVTYAWASKRFAETINRSNWRSECFPLHIKVICSCKKQKRKCQSSETESNVHCIVYMKQIHLVGYRREKRRDQIESRIKLASFFCFNKQIHSIAIGALTDKYCVTDYLSILYVLCTHLFVLCLYARCITPTICHLVILHSSTVHGPKLHLEHDLQWTWSAIDEDPPAMLRLYSRLRLSTKHDGNYCHIR